MKCLTSNQKGVTWVQVLKNGGQLIQLKGYPIEKHDAAKSMMMDCAIHYVQGVIDKVGWEKKKDEWLQSIGVFIKRKGKAKAAVEKRQEDGDAEAGGQAEAGDGDGGDDAEARDAADEEGPTDKEKTKP
eukprot:2959560-Pyramimonas_sp.AAC.1